MLHSAALSKSPLLSTLLANLAIKESLEATTTTTN